MNVVKIAELKSRLSEYLRRVRRGHPLTVMDRETPIARIVPYESGPGPLVEVECLRTLDRLRLLEAVADDQIAARRETIYRLLESVEVVEPTRPILARASQPMPAALGTLDAIHLATALVWRERTGENLVLATHDSALGLAGRASGVHVIGL